MNHLQRIILLAGLLVVTGFCLRPPYWREVTKYQFHGPKPEKLATFRENAGHYWIWSPPDESPLTNGRVVAESCTAWIDWQRLSIYTGLVTAFCLFLTFVIFKNSLRQSKPSTLE